MTSETDSQKNAGEKKIKNKNKDKKERKKRK